MDFARARLNMVESQIRPNGITDKRLLSTLATIPREMFVPAAQKPLAYIDEDVLIAEPPRSPSRRYLIEPMAFARLIQLLAVEPENTVLDIGCASGYSTTVLSEIGAHVTGLEADGNLAEQAIANLSRMAIANAEVITGEHAAGLPAKAPFNTIFINGRVPVVPSQLLEQLDVGGRLVAVVGERSVAKAFLYTRTPEGWSTAPAFDASIAPLPGFPTPQPAFVF